MKHTTIQLIKEVNGKIQYVKVSVPNWEIKHFGLAAVTKKYSELK